MPTMHENITLVALVSLALLFGCAGNGVAQEKYDALSASCSKERNGSAALLSDEMAKTASANARASSCAGERQSLEALLSVRDSENAALKVKAAVLDAAREKTGRIAQYGLALQYYQDAFGPGKVPNTARLKKIDAQLAVVNDAALTGLVSGVRNCQGITDCEHAKAMVQPYVEKQQQRLALEASAIVGAGQ